MSEPLALELLAAMVPDQEVRILDLRVDSDLRAALTSFAPDVVAVTALTTEVYAAQQALHQAKQHSDDVFTAVGGLHATLMPQDFQLPCIDAICLGEGEFVFPHLIKALNTEGALRDVPNLIWQDADGRFVANGRSLPQVSGEVIPFPRRDLVADWRSAYSFLHYKPDTSVATGRGCPFRCNFCSVWEFYQGRTRQMSAARVVDELRTVETKHVTFVDDNFMLDARRENEIADRIKAEGIRRSFSMECRTDSIVRHPELIEKWVGVGLEGVLLGIEGASDEALARVNKRNTARTNDEAIRILQANGVLIWGAFIASPDWTAEQFRALREYVHENGITHTQFTVLTPLPGTPLYRQMQAELLTNDYTCFDTLHAVVPTRLPREEFYQHFASLYLKPNLKQIYRYLDGGQLTMEQIRYGHKVYQQLGRWQDYLEHDPVLGGRTAAPATTAVEK
jgi:radical SAM superfamily enzyme YgiQ (UPF0313 family)